MKNREVGSNRDVTLFKKGGNWPGVTWSARGGQIYGRSHVHWGGLILMLKENTLLWVLTVCTLRRYISL